MKNYPKALADVEALQSVLKYLFDRAESLSEDVDRYELRSKEHDENEGESENTYWHDQAVECQVKAAACIRLAERLAK